MEGLPIVRYLTPRSCKMEVDVFIYRSSLIPFPPHPTGSNNCRGVDWHREHRPTLAESETGPIGVEEPGVEQ